MANIQDLRKLYPEFDQYGYSDSQVLEWVGGELGQDPMQLAEYYGLRDPDQGDFSRGISAGIDSTKALGYGLVGLAGDAVGVDGVRDFGIQGYQRNMDKVSLNSRDTDSYEGINGVGDAVDFAQYYSGMAIPQAATALVSGGVGGLIGKQVVKSAVKKKLGDGLKKEATDLLAKGGKLGSYAGVGTQAIGTELGATYGQAVEEAQANGESIDDINLGRVAGYGALAGSLELVGDVATLGLARLGPAANLLDAARKTRTRGAVTGLAAGSAIEGVTEGLQTGLEDMGAGRSAEDARFFDPTSVLAGAIGGGQLGVVGGALRAPTSSGTELDTTAAQNEVQEQLSLPLDNPNDGTVAEATQLAEAQAANDRVVQAEATEAEAVVTSRVEAAKTYTPRKMFLTQRDKKLEEQNKIDIEDPSTAIHATFQEDLTKRRAEGESFYDPVDIEGAKTKFLKDAAKGAKDEVAGNVAYEAALDEYAANLSNQQQELDFAQQNEAEKATVAVQERQAIIDAPAKSTVKAIEKAEALYGKDWVNSGQYDELAAVVNGGKFRQKNFEAAIEKIENPPIDVNALTTTREQKLLAVNQAVATVSEGLSGKNEKAVFDTFTKAVLNFEGDKYLQQRVLANKKDGTMARSVTQLEKDADVKPGSAQKVLDRVIPKFRDALGITEEEYPAFLASLKLQPAAPVSEIGTATDVVVDQPGDNLAADETGASLDAITGTDANAATERTGAINRLPEVDAPIQSSTNLMDADEVTDSSEALDKAEFGVNGGFSTKDSVNQGAYDGFTDVQEFTQARSQEANPVYEARVKQQKVAHNNQIEQMTKDFLPAARTQWTDGVSKGGPRFNQLSTVDQVEWISAVHEHSETGNDALLAQDLREIETRYDADNAGVTMENTDGQTNDENNDGGESGGSQGSERSGDQTGSNPVEDNAPVRKEKPAPKIVKLVPKPELILPTKVKYTKPAKGRLMPKVFKTGKSFIADVFHGTRSDIQKFDSTRLGENTGAGSAQEAFFFGGKPETANSYAENPSKNMIEAETERTFIVAKKWLTEKKLSVEEQGVLGNILKVAKEIENGEGMLAGLVQAAKEQPKAVARHARALATRLKPMPQPNVQIQRIRMENPFVHDYKGAKYREKTYLSIITEAKENGHDGVVLLNTYDRAGKTRSQLGQADLDNIFAVFDTENITNTYKERQDKIKFGIPDAPVATATRAAFSTATKKLTGETSNMRIHVFDTVADAIVAVETGVVPETSIDQLMQVKPYGWVIEDSNGDPHAHFILERIAKGREKSAFMHEVGGHVGIDSVLDTDQQRDIARQIYDWAGKDDKSLESQIARRTISRIDLAAQRGGVSEGSVVSEAIAYFLEEATIAGVEPSVDSSLGKFLQKLRDLFVTALSKIGMGGTVDLTAQDVIDMAMGAAQIELMHGQTDISMQSPVTSPSMTAAARYGINRDWVGENMGGPTAQKVYDNTAELAKKAALSTKFVHNIVRDVRETMPALGRWYDGMIKAEAVRNEIRQQFADVQKRARALKSGRLVAVNNFLGESTFEQKWGYDPKEYHPELFSDRAPGSGNEVVIDTVKRLQFQRMSSEEKQLVADIFAHGERMRQRKVALAKKLGVAGKFFTDASLVGPYAPLKRFGNYAGELKSARLVAAEKASKAEGATKEQKDAYEKLKSDSDNYVISFFDTIGSAKEFVDQNKKNYAFSQTSERAPNLDSDRVSNPEVYEKVMAALAASDSSDMDSGAKTAFRDMVRGMYFQSMDERSARTSGARRLNRAGYEQNMIRSFINHGKSEASLMAQMENGTEINTALAEAGNETLTETGEVRDPEKQRVFNGISKHYQNMLKGIDTPIQDRITTMNSVYMLLTSVGYHVTNATQPAMVTVPRIAGDFGNYSGTWSALFRGYKVAMASSKLGLNMETSIDLEKVPTKYRALLKMLQDRQLIDQGMEEDGSFDRFNTGFEKLNQASDVLGTITSKLYNVAKFVESQNRISSAVAAYDMAVSNTSKLAEMNMTAEQYATAVVEDTQGNFSQLDAPLLIKSLPKIVVQYRKYQLLMAWHYSNAFKQGFAGETPEIKAAGKRVLGYSIAHAALGAGATGVPLLSTAFWLTTFLGDEDEPQDMERWIKDNIDDGAFGTALSRGLFSSLGLDLSTKLNQSKIFHPLPYADFQAGEAGATDILMGLAGPAGTTGVNFFRAAEYFKQGDVLKGIEYSVPKGLRTVAESYRLATEGYTTKLGTVIVDPREIDSMSLLLNAMGLPATEINRIKWTRGQQYELEQYFNKEGSKIRKKYIEATRNRDRTAQGELRQEFRDLQKSKDRVRPFFNDAPGALNRQSLSTLLKAPRNREKLEKKEQMKLQ